MTMPMKISKYREVMRRLKSGFMQGLMIVGSVAAIAPLFLIFIYLVIKGLPALNIDFFTQNPLPLGEPGGGVANGLMGSALVVALACVMGIPLGIGVGLFLYEFRQSPLAQVIGLATDILASVPSILIGLYAYALWVKPIHSFSAFAAGFALGLMMIPLVARSSEEILTRTPDHIREAGLALGIPRWKVTLKIVLRGAVSGVTTGVVLSLARIAGETAPLLYTAFGNQFGFKGWFQPIATLPMQIFEFATSPYESWQNMAWTAALVLVLFIFVINLSVRFIFKSPEKESR